MNYSLLNYWAGKTKKILSNLVLLIAIACVTSCGSKIEADPDEHLYAVKQGKYYGFIDPHGQMVVSPQFAYAFNFSEGLAAVNIGGTTSGRDVPTDGKWGFINPKGQFIINPFYYSPENGALPYDLERLPLVMHDGYRFVDSLAAVRLEEGWVYINTENQIAIPKAYTEKDGEKTYYIIQSARTFQEGRAAVYLGDGWGYIDKTGKIVIEPKYLFPIDFRQGFAVLMTKKEERVCIDRDGHRVFSQYRIETNFHESISSFKEGFKGERTFDSDKYRLGMMNRQGHILVQAQFDEVGFFGNGLCPVLVGSEKSGTPTYSDLANTQDIEGGKWGYVNTNGFFQINPVYDWAKGFRSGLAAVKTGHVWGYINTSQQAVFPPQFKFAGFFDGPVAIVRLRPEGQDTYENRFAYINTDGEIIWIE